ncbi:MAG: citramalate synthase [Candidatus Omnitrophica bacterium CG1_02_44_16]|nr:MAG: citramalate synthase [Candidatus Omnitrophica bacterium CG1_02_44_16]PIY82172.1 MAG: citramalate synthase [Candidatus Omnitrophica bacterium CG_4_10_14_0_8_um_filter_44_12]PIZ83469.1 MAG: citramalate synthase [Candidatus Omnitrophica bacterium CG_4_10_14_0_2_um_filter_44_9]
MNKIELYDTTLRDGSQTEGISYSVFDKIRIARKLDDLGMCYIEGGYPGSNPKDKSFFNDLKKCPLKNAKLVAFGSTRKVKIAAKDDNGLKSLVESGAATAAIFGKTWDMHVRDVLKVSLQENLEMIRDSVSYLVSEGMEVIYDAEHFFDAYKANPEYALKTLQEAEESGARLICLCDTNGGTLTSQIVDIIKQVRPNIKIALGIHTHNDLGLAVANSIAAVQSGCMQVQGTMNGYGERCGNADLIPIIGILKLKLKIDCISDERLKELTEVSRFVSEISNMKQAENQPFVGKSAFAHKAGMHINAILKNTKSYEHVDPSLVGNQRRALVSELAGKSPILTKAEELHLDIKKDSPEAKKVLKLLQDLENEGYQFESADASFEILIKKALKTYKKFFVLEGFRVIVEKRDNGKLYSEAMIKLKVGDVREHTSSEGDGPVNALDNALRKALKGFYPAVSKMHLSDFKVRVLGAKEGTAAKVRVLIQSQDERDTWTTVGVSGNIIEASWQALVDSMEYKLLKDANK